MRLLFPVLALPMIVPAASTAQTISPAMPVREMPVVDPNARSPLTCPPTSRYEAAKQGGKLGLRKLHELPMADGYKAVVRHIGGCNAPIIVSYGVGGEQR